RHRGVGCVGPVAVVPVVGHQIRRVLQLLRPLRDDVLPELRRQAVGNGEAAHIDVGRDRRPLHPRVGAGGRGARRAGDQRRHTRHGQDHEPFPGYHHRSSSWFRQSQSSDGHGRPPPVPVTPRLPAGEGCDQYGRLRPNRSLSLTRCLNINGCLCPVNANNLHPPFGRWSYRPVGQRYERCPGPGTGEETAMEHTHQRRRRLAGAALLSAAVVAGALSSSAALAAPAEGQVRYADSATAIQGNYIVVLKDGVTTSAGSLAANYGGRVGFTYTRALHGFSATMDPAAARRLAADPPVAYVQQNRTVHRAGPQPTPPP